MILGTVCTRLKPNIDAILACIATIQAQLRSQLRESSTSILTSSIWGLTAACSQILMSKALDLTSTSPTLKLLKLVKLPYTPCPYREPHTIAPTKWSSYIKYSRLYIRIKLREKSSLWRRCASDCDRRVDFYLSQKFD